jgi:hypothetical protein
MFAQERILEEYWRQGDKEVNIFEFSSKIALIRHKKQFILNLSGTTAWRLAFFLHYYYYWDNIVHSNDHVQISPMCDRGTVTIEKSQVRSLANDGDA